MAAIAFPPEVLENIFQFLDGRSFCVARGVCKAWNEVIKSMQTKEIFWKRICIEEVPGNVLQEILGFKNIFFTNIDWMTIYKKWYLSRMVLTSPYWKKKICAFYPIPITCVRLSGSWVITAHSSGLLCVWNLQNGDLHQNFMCHLKAINDIALVDLLNLGSYPGSEELPWAHHHIITISKDRYIHIMSLLEPMIDTDSDIHINYHTDDLKQVKVFGDIFAVSCRDNTVTLWKMKVVRKPYFQMQVSFLQKIVGPQDYILSMGFWQDEVQCVSNSGRLKAISVHEEEWIEKKYFKKSYAEEGSEIIFSVTAAFLFRQQTVIMLTGDGKIIISVDESCNRHYYLMKNLQTILVSIAFHGSILALGGENGKLFLFYVNNEEQLINLELSKPDLTVSLSEASIISIDISYHQDSPVIAASTTESIHIIKWYKTHASHQKVKKRELCQLFS